MPATIGPEVQSDPDPAPATADTDRWRPVLIGDPGRAAAGVVPRPDPDVPERPDTVLDGYAVHDPAGRAALELRAASVRGLAHRYYGRVRQDSYTARATHDGRWVVAVVADGVSGGPHSHVAADTATRDAGRDLAELAATVPVEHLDWPALLARTSAAVAAALGEHVGGDVDPAEAGATTLLAAVVATEPGAHGRRRAHLIGVGDSSAWLLADGAWHRVLGGKDDAVYASSATAALPRLPATPPAPVVVDLGAGDVLALVTDGIGDPLADGEGEVGASFAEAWADPPAPLAFAAQVDFVRRSYDDDRTAVALWALP